MHRVTEAAMVLCGLTLSASALLYCRILVAKLQLRREAARMSFAVRLVEACVSGVRSRRASRLRG